MYCQPLEKRAGGGGGFSTVIGRERMNGGIVGCLTPAGQPFFPNIREVFPNILGDDANAATPNILVQRVVRVH